MSNLLERGRGLSLLLFIGSNKKRKKKDQKVLWTMWVTAETVGMTREVASVRVSAVVDLSQDVGG
jgi:hypothetical protein